MFQLHMSGLLMEIEHLKLRVPTVYDKQYTCNARGVSVISNDKYLSLKVADHGVTVKK